jgi:VanZ family protein
MRFSIVKPWLVVFLYFGLLIGLSSIPRLHLPEPGEVPTDKFCHLLAYGGLGFLLARTRTSWWLALMVGIALGALDECYQIFVPDRSANVRDWEADCVGVVLGILAWNLIVKSLFKMKYLNSPAVTRWILNHDSSR